MSTKFFETNLKEVKQADDNQQIFYFVASSSVVDRDLDLVISEGCDAANFEKNPVFLFGHNWRDFPIGKVVDIKVTPDEVIIGVVFASTPEGQRAAYLYKEGFMNAVSIGFIPKSIIRVPEDEEVTSIEVTVNGRKRKINLSKLPVRPRNIIPEWELLEVSAVTVPANPQALIRRSMESLASKYGLDIKECEFIEEELVKEAEGILTKMKENLELFVKGAVPRHHTPINTEVSWDKRRAIANLARWASTDGSGEKEKIRWSKFAKGFGWFDPEKKTAFSGYKLPHHDIVDGNFVAVWRGVTAAMAALFGARGGVKIPDKDRKPVYNHLAGHYKDAGKEPPPFKKDYTEEELKAIEEDRWPLEQDSKQADDKGTSQTDGKKEDPIKELLQSVLDIKKQLAELEISITTRLRILENEIDEKFDSTCNIGQKEQTTSPTPDDILKEAWELATKLEKKL